MKKLLTLLSLCPLAYAGDSSPRLLLCIPGQPHDASHEDMNIPSPLRRTGTPHMSKSFTEMPTIDAHPKHKLGGHRRERSKTIISVETSSPCPSPARPTTPLRSNSMHHPLGAHKIGLIPTIAVHEEPSASQSSPASAALLLQQQVDELRSENQVLKEKLEKLGEIDQLRKDQAMLEIKISNWQAKKQNAKDEVAEREKQLTKLVQTIGDTAVTMAALESGDLLHRINLLVSRQEEIQQQQIKLIATVQLLLDKQTAQAQEQQAACKPSHDHTSPSKKPMSARLSELGNIFSGSKSTLRPDSVR